MWKARIPTARISHRRGQKTIENGGRGGLNPRIVGRSRYRDEGGKDVLSDVSSAGKIASPSGYGEPAAQCSLLPMTGGQ